MVKVLLVTKPDNPVRIYNLNGKVPAMVAHLDFLRGNELSEEE